MTVSEALGSLAGWDVRILATDLSTNVLEKARRAVYPAEAVARMPRALVAKYFERRRRQASGDDVAVKAPVRAAGRTSAG